jgi:hypothetical protein
MKHIIYGIIGCLVAFDIASFVGMDYLIVSIYNRYNNEVYVNAETEALHKLEYRFVQGDKTYHYSK